MICNGLIMSKLRTDVTYLPLSKKKNKQTNKKMSPSCKQQYHESKFHLFFQRE